MKVITLAIFLLFSIVFGFAQTLATDGYATESPLSYVYQLTNEEATEIYKEYELEVKEEWFHTLVDTFSIKYDPKHLPVGHYMIVKAIGEELEVELKSKNSFSVQTLKNKRDLDLRIVDSLGNLIENAQVLYKKKVAPFHPKTQSYRLKKWNKSGILKVIVGSETAFFQLHRRHDRSKFTMRYRRFESSSVGSILTIPVKIVRAPIRYVSRGIKYFHWRIPFYRLNPFYSLFDNVKELKGYVATNKPKYQPGDTVKVKAFLAKPNGKPFRKAIRMQFATNGYRKIIFEKTIQPNPKGNIVYEFVLGDSLSLDKQYNFIFEPQKRAYNWNGLRQTILYEDYQLDKTAYTLEPTQSTFQNNEKIILLTEGKDKNGFTVPDGQVRLTIKPIESNKFHEKEVWLPDTLWTHEQALDSRDQTQIIVPDSIFPSADLKAQVIAQFYNSSGELIKKRCTFSVLKKREVLKLKIEDGFLKADYFVNGESISSEAVLDYKNKQDLNRRETVRLPYQQRINPFVSEYRIEAKSLKEELVLKKDYRFEGAEIYAFGERTADSIFIQIQNPHRLPINYLIQTKQQIIAEGSTDSNLNWRHADSSNKVYFLKYNYVWGGESYFNEKTFQAYKKLLNVSVKQPSSISPGETIPIKIKVQDYKDQGARGVNLTAGAINAEFGSASNFKMPEVPYKPAKEPAEINSFTIGKPYLQTQEKIPFSQFWYRKLDLDSLLFYKMRYDNGGVLMHYEPLVEDTFYKDVAQFAPYLIKNNKTQPLYLIYCNNELVYWYDVDDEPPYSFIRQEGWNSILIRTLEWEYKIDSVWLKNGHKLELVIDEDHYLKSPHGKNVKRKSTLVELTDFEKNLLKKRILLLRTVYKGAQNHLWQSNNIHLFHQKYISTQAIGPFKPFNELTFMVQGGFSNTFLFEPGFQYDILKNRERLFEDKRFDQEEIFLPEKLDWKIPGQLVYTPKDIKNSIKESLHIQFSSFPETTQAGNGKYQIAFQNIVESEDPLVAFVLAKNDSNFVLVPPVKQTLHNLQPGSYDFYGFTKSGQYFKKEVFIRRDTLLYQHLDEFNLEFNKDTALFNHFIKKSKPRLNFDPRISLDAKNRNNQNRGAGRYVTGTITDESGEPLIGASILIPGTSTGTVTDVDGTYRIWVPDGHENVTVSYTGYSSVELWAGGSDKLNVPMDASAVNLSEMVVTGLGKKARGADKYATIDLVAKEKKSFKEDMIASPRYFGGGPVYSPSWGRSEEEEAELNLGTSSIRTHFADYAFWKPYLHTDQNGEAYFNATYPENITSWQTFVVGQDAKARAGVGYATTKSYKKLMAQLAMPRFLIEGDETAIIGRTINYTNDTFDIQTVFRLGEEVLKTNEADVGEVLVENMNVKASARNPFKPFQSGSELAIVGGDSLDMTYLLKMGDYEDGERRKIPIYPQGVEERVGDFHILEGDTTLELAFDKELGAVSIYAQKDMLQVFLEDIEYLKGYPYGCNEQTASRLTALLLEKQIREQLNEPFEHEKALIAAIVQLKKSQNVDGSWGWWQGGQSNSWMTTYVLRALWEAQQQNYRTEAFDKGLKYLTNAVHLFDRKDLLNTLQLFSNIGQNFDYEPFVNHLDTTLTSLYDKVALLQIRHSNNLEMTFDTLEKYQRQTTFGGTYWNEDSYDWYNNSIPTTLLAYKIYKTAGQEAICKKIRQYFLERRGGSGWRNTIETARILATIIPDLAQTMALEKPTLAIGENKVSNFPYEARVAPEKLKIRKLGGGQLYFTTYQTFQNRNPKAKSGLFEIKTHLEQKGKRTNNLEKAEKTTLVAKVNAQESANYVMIEIPIPASCSYGSKNNSRAFPEVHREYFREKVSIFCEHLPEGDYTFKIDLEPRFSGSYILNPAKVEQMYFPVFYGRNEGGRVEVD